MVQMLVTALVVAGGSMDVTAAQGAEYTKKRVKEHREIQRKVSQCILTTIKVLERLIGITLGDRV